MLVTPKLRNPADQSIARRVHCCVRPCTRAAPMIRQAFKPSFPACPIIYWRYKPPNLGPWHFSTTAGSLPQLGMDRTIADIAEGTSVSPTEYGKLLAEETKKWAKVVRAANVKP